MAILVVGATGTVGREVLSQLLALSPTPSIRVSSRDPSKASFPSSVEVVKADFDDPSSFPTLFSRVSRAFLYAPKGGHVPALVAAAKDAGVQHIVLLSSFSVNRNPLNAIGLRHKSVEDVILASGIPYTFLRPANFATNTVRFWSATIKAKGQVFFVYPLAETAVIAPEDIAAVAVVALTTHKLDNATPLIAGPESLTQKAQVEILNKVRQEYSGGKVELVEVTPEQLKASNPHLPPPVADSMLDFLREAVGRKAEVTAGVDPITGKKRLTYEGWVRRHAEQVFGAK